VPGALGKVGGEVVLFVRIRVQVEQVRFAISADARDAFPT